MLSPASEARTNLDSPWEQLWSEAIITPLQVGYFDCEPTWQLPERVRPHYQLWLVVGGRATLTIATRSLDLTEGVAVLVPPNVPHCGSHRPSDPLRCYVLHFTLRVQVAVAPITVGALPLRMQPSPAIWQDILNHADRIDREFADRRPGQILMARGATEQLIGLLWREAGTRGMPAGAASVIGSNESLARLTDVIAYISEHFTASLSLAELADVAHLSPAHFSTVFRRATGLSPFQYLQRYRIQRARDLLSTTSDSVADIAVDVGYTDPFYFSRAFKRLEGMSPMHYRQSKQSPFFP